MKDMTNYKNWQEKRYRERWLPAYLAFIALYPFGLDDLPGEIWAWISGYEGLYQISNFGRVKSFPKRNFHGTIILKPKINRQGYLRVGLHKNGKVKHFPIHRLVAQAFIPNPDNLPEPNHEDGCKFNNHVSNLKWSTKSENMQHAARIGIITGLHGEKNPMAKLTDAQCEEIRQIYTESNGTISMRVLANKYDVAPATIWRIVNGKTYKNVD